MIWIVRLKKTPIGIETKEVCVPSAFCVKKAEPEVSLFCDDILGWNVCMFLFFYKSFII